MDRDLQLRLEAFVRPLYQDLDGVSRFDDVERVSKIARALYRPPTETDSRSLELLLLFHGLGKWLEKVGNASRTTLAVPGIEEDDLRRTAASIRRLEVPQTTIECAVAAALLIDRAGLRGLVMRFAAARREGHTLLDVVRESLAESWTPAWVADDARAMLEKRFEVRRRFCQELLEEL